MLAAGVIHQISSFLYPPSADLLHLATCPLPPRHQAPKHLLVLLALAPDCRQLSEKNQWLLDMVEPSVIPDTESLIIFIEHIEYTGKKCLPLQIQSPTDLRSNSRLK